jgi:tetratricopeptide (TPR) repeat protein
MRPIACFGTSVLAGLAVMIAHLAAQDGGPDIVRSRLIAPPDSLAYYDRLRDAAGRFNARQFADAAAAYQESVKQYPFDGAVWISLGNALRLAGQAKAAIGAYEKGLELTSIAQPFNVRYFLARCYLAAGDTEGAYRTLETVLNQDQYVRKPDLYDDPAFAALRSEARFQKLVGHIDTSKMSRSESWQADIDYLVSEITRVNHLYRTQPLPENFMARYTQLKRDVPNLSDEEIFTGMGAMLAPLHQGHVSIAVVPETRLPALRTLPVQFYAFPEGVFIVDADTNSKDLIGTEVLKIQDFTSAEVLKLIEDHTSVENQMRILGWSGTGVLGSIPVLRGVGVVGRNRNEVRLTLRTNGGATTDRMLGSVAIKPGVDDFAAHRKLAPPPNVTPPLFLRNVPRAHWFQALPESDAIFVQVNQIAPDRGETMPEFGLKLRKYLSETPANNIILDLRHNNGGNTGSYTELLRTLVGHRIQEGNLLYVIIGRGTYSATANLITDLERLANPVFVGEPSGGTGNQDGDESYVVLPYSGIRGWLTSVRWQYSHPWDQRTSLVPNIPVQLTARAYFAGQDPALDTILARIKRSRR